MHISNELYLEQLQDAIHFAKKHEQKYWDSPDREKYSKLISQLEADFNTLNKLLKRK